MESPPLGQFSLQLAPCDPEAPFLARSLLPPLQHAVQHQHGLLLLHLPADVVQRTGLAALRERRGGASYAAIPRSYPDLPPEAYFVEPGSSPTAAAALHTLGSELTKAHMLRMKRRSTALEPFLDTLQDWLQPEQGSDERVHSRLVLSTSSNVADHMDRGLFNIVVGRHIDIGTIQLNLPDHDVDVYKCLPPSEEIEDDELLALIIPGYTLQCIDSSVPAVVHSVPHRQEAVGRAVLVLQWRMHPQYKIGEATVGQLMEQFTSVRTKAHGELTRRRGEEYLQHKRRCMAAVPAAPGYWAHVAMLTGRTLHLPAHPEWTILNLKSSIEEAEGLPIDQVVLLHQGHEPEEGETLAGSGITNGCILHLVLKLRGD